MPIVYNGLKYGCLKCKMSDFVTFEMSVSTESEKNYAHF